MSSGGEILKNPVGHKPATAIFVLLARSLSIAIVVAAPFVQTKQLLWTATAIFAFIWIVDFLSCLLCRSHFKDLYEVRPDSTDGEGNDESLPGVTLISPARNEDAAIEEAATSLAKLDYPNLEVIVVNDHSTDGTRAILERLQETYPQLLVFHDPPFQEGWLGKANAVWFAVQNANPENKWLLLTDGDVMFDPKTVRRAVAHVEEAQWDFFTCVPFLDNGSFSEELLLTHGWRGMIIASSLRMLNKPGARPTGIGAFILVKRLAYLESGGHSAIRNQQPEDTLLGDLIKRHGGRIGVGWTSSMIRVRLYRGYAQLRSFLVRKTRVSVDDSLLSLAARALFCWLYFILPFVMGIGALGYQLTHRTYPLPLTCYTVTALGCYVNVAFAMRQARAVAYARPGLHWLHPLGGALRFWLTIVAMGEILAKKRMDWRGRDFQNIRAESDGNTA